mmetsp:Transcript_20857/g.69636  ORF Transcript_20857/g.69636 Transcript_20857/m.69636 type:complete len:2210 (-) Transcript_20857:31-6660(-)
MVVQAQDDGSETFLNELFVHAVWKPDIDEGMDGEDRAHPDDVATQQAEGLPCNEKEIQGYQSFARSLVTLSDRATTLPDPYWLSTIEDGKFSSQLRLGYANGEAAARMHALARKAWNLELSPTKKLLIIIHEIGLTLLSGSDEFCLPKAEWSSTIDYGSMFSAGKWRRVAWEQEGSCIAVAEVDGSGLILSVPNLRPVARIPTLLPLPTPAVDIAFLRSSCLSEGDSSSPSKVLLALSYDGMLYCHPAATKSGAPVYLPEPLDLSPWHTNVSCMVVGHARQIIAIGGWNAEKAQGTSNSPPISLWAVEDRPPVFKCLFSTAVQKPNKALRIVNLARAALRNVGRRELDTMVMKMVFSESGNLLAALEACGDITVIDCVSFAVKVRFTQDELYKLSPAGPLCDQLGERKQSSFLSACGDISWWDETSLVISRRDGKVVVVPIRKHSKDHLELGEFHINPSITSAISEKEGGLFVLECCRTVNEEDSFRGETVGDAFGSTNIPWYRRLLGTSFSRRGEESVIENQRFLRKYRLISICKSTVGRVVQRKIDMKDYEAALKVADKYNLPGDPIYKSQWLHAKVSEESVDRYLRNVSDLQWVLDQCFKRHCQTCGEAKVLAKYGYDRCLQYLQDFSAMDDTADKPLIEKSKLLFEQRMVWLEIFQSIYPGDSLNETRLRWFSEQGPSNVVILLAMDEECEALSVVYDRFRSSLDTRLFTILSYLPETCRPKKFDKLIPDLRTMAEDAEEERHQVTVDEMIDWCKSRVVQIEQRTGLVDVALELLESVTRKIPPGTARLPELQQLSSSFNHLFTLVYECGIDVQLCEWEKLDAMGRLRMFVKNSSRETFVADLRDLAGPFLVSLGEEAGEKLLHDFLVELAKERIDWCAKVFQRSTIEEPLYTLSCGATGRDWSSVRPISFASWSRKPPDVLRGRMKEEILIAEYETDIPVREQAVLWAGMAAGEASQALLVLCSSSSSVDAVCNLTQEGRKSAGVGGDKQEAAGLGDAGDKKELPLGPLPSISVFAVLSGQHSMSTWGRITKNRILHDPMAMIDVALRCVYASSSENEDFLQAASDIYCSLPKRDAAALSGVKHQARYLELQDKADELDRHITAMEVLQSYGISKPIAFFQDCRRDAEVCYGTIRSMCRYQVRQEARNQSAFRHLQKDLFGSRDAGDEFQGLVSLVFDFLDVERCRLIFMEALLDANMFSLAYEVMQGSISSISSQGSDQLVSGYVSLILKVSRENFDSASCCRDAAWQNAKTCLDLISVLREGVKSARGDEEEQEEGAGGESNDPFQEVKKELELIEAVEILDELKLEPLPVQIRKHKDPVAIVRRLITEAPGVLVNGEEILRFGVLLGLSSKEAQLEIMEMISRASVDQVKQNTSLSKVEKSSFLENAVRYIHLLVEAGKASAWDLCVSLVETEDTVMDGEVKSKLLAFAMAHCKAESFAGIMEKWRASKAEVQAEMDEKLMARWTSKESLEEGILARVPPSPVMKHPFYFSLLPGAPTSSKIDRYSFSYHDEDDIFSRAVEESLNEAARVLIKLRTKGGGAQQEEGADVFFQLLALATSHSDLQLFEGALLSLSPRRLVRCFDQHLHLQYKSQVAQGKDGRKLLDTAIVLCHIARKISDRSSKLCDAKHPVPSLLDPLAPPPPHDEGGPANGFEGMSLTQGRETIESLRDGGDGEAKSWAVLSSWYSTLSKVLVKFGDPQVLWLTLLICNPSLEPLPLVRKEITQDNLSRHVKCLQAIQPTWQPPSSSSPPLPPLGPADFDAILDAREAMHSFTSHGLNSDNLSIFLGSRSPFQLCKLVKEILASCPREDQPHDLLVKVLDAVHPDPCSDAHERDWVRSELHKLRLDIDEQATSSLMEHYNKIVFALAESGVATTNLPPMAAEEEGFCRGVCDVIQQVKEEEQLYLVAQLLCLRDSSLSLCLFALSTGKIGRAPAGGDLAASRAGSLVGAELGDLPACGPNLSKSWALLVRRSIELGLPNCCLSLRCGPARYGLSKEEESELQALARSRSRVLGFHFAVLSPRGSMRSLGLSQMAQEEGGVDGENADLEWLLESCMRCGSFAQIEASHLFRSHMSQHMFRVFPVPTREEEEAEVSARSPYLVMDAASGLLQAVVPRRQEILVLAVLDLWQAGEVVAAAKLVCRYTRTHRVFHSDSTALMVMKVFLSRIAQAGDQGRSSSSASYSPGLKERCAEMLKELETV